MQIGNVDSKDNVIVVAEIGNNHEGSIEVARELIDRAAETGVDAVKFQTYRTETFVAPTQKERYQRMKNFELSNENFLELSDRAHQHSLKFISTPLDLQSAFFLDKIVDAIKISSGDNTFYPLIEYAASTDKPLIISTGFASESKIRFTTALVENIRMADKRNLNLALLHCVSAYPVAIKDANLAAIQRLKKYFGQKATIGYSDHTLGIQAATLAISAGARIIEKHFTLDLNYSKFRDHQLSADPPMMKQLVDGVREAEILLGDGNLTARKIEKESEIPVRRSIAAAQDLDAGITIKMSDLMWIRPGEGYAPGSEHQILGKTLARPMQTGELFTKEIFDSEN